MSGRLQIRPWTDKGVGNKRYSTEVAVENMYFGDSKPDGKKNAGAKDSEIPEDFNPGFYE